MKYDPKFWDQLAEEYAAKPVDDPEAFERKKALTKARMASSDRLLEVGCGTGTLALELARHCRSIDAIDFSPGMIAIAQRKAKAASVDNVAFVTSTLEDFDAEPGSYDGICAYSILHLVPDRAATLARMHTLLKPGGFLVASTVCLGDSAVPYGLILPVMRWVGKAPPVAIVRRDQLADEMRAAGFEGITHPDVGAKPTIAFTVAQKAAGAVRAA